MPRPHPRPRLAPKRLIPFALTALLLTTAAVPLAYLTAPYARRALRLSQLDSPNPDARRLALAYAARHLTHPTHGQPTRNVVFHEMRNAGPDRFREYQQLLDTLGQWRHDAVPEGIWRSWIGLLLRSEEPDIRVEAAWLLADLPGIAGAEYAHQPLSLLAADNEPNVRLNAVAAMAELAGQPQARDAYTHALTDIADHDADPALRNEAQRLLAAIDAQAKAERSAALDIPWLPQPTPDQLQQGLASPNPALQAYALTLATLAPPDGFDPAAAAEQLLRSFDPVDRRAGALLAGYTQTHLDLLRERLDAANDYPEATLLKLALHLHGHAPDGFQPTHPLTTPDALPMPLIQWALIHPAFATHPHPTPQAKAERGTSAALGIPAALDDLLNPRGDAPPDLVEYLVHQHGWAALAAFTHRVGPPPSPDNPAAAELAVERLRDHWLVTRRRHATPPPPTR